MIDIFLNLASVAIGFEAWKRFKDLQSLLVTSFAILSGLLSLWDYIYGESQLAGMTTIAALVFVCWNGWLKYRNRDLFWFSGLGIVYLVTHVFKKYIIQDTLSLPVENWSIASIGILAVQIIIFIGVIIVLFRSYWKKR